MEQFVRDARIAQIYEGTNGIQALDLLGRKIMADKGEMFNAFCDEVKTALNDHDAFPYKEQLLEQVNELHQAVSGITKQDNVAMQVNGLACETLAALGHVCFSYMWLLQWQVLDQPMKVNVTISWSSWRLV